MYRAGLTVQKFWGTVDHCTEHLTNRLVAEAYPEDRNLAAEGSNHVHADSGVGRGTGSGRDEHTVVTTTCIWSNRVIATNIDLRTELGQVLNEVEDERIVVVDDENPSAHDPIIPQTDWGYWRRWEHRPSRR